jgi:hypothetical protein
LTTSRPVSAVTLPTPTGPPTRLGFGGGGPIGSSDVAFPRFAGSRCSVEQVGRRWVLPSRTSRGFRQCHDGVTSNPKLTARTPSDGIGLTWNPITGFLQPRRQFRPRKWYAHNRPQTPATCLNPPPGQKAAGSNPARGHFVFAGDTGVLVSGMYGSPAAFICPRSWDVGASDSNDVNPGAQTRCALVASAFREHVAVRRNGSVAREVRPRRG